MLDYLIARDRLLAETAFLSNRPFDRIKEICRLTDLAVSETLDEELAAVWYRGAFHAMLIALHDGCSDVGNLQKQKL